MDTSLYIKIDNLEIMKKDLGHMNWVVAKKACAALGNGWRLPTKNELNILYNNKDKIGGFASHFYWSSSEYDSNIPWVQYFGDGSQSSDYKALFYAVRAVRGF